MNIRKTERCRRYSFSACCTLHDGSLLGLLHTLKREAICSFEKSVDLADYTTLYPRRQNCLRDNLFEGDIYIIKKIEKILLNASNEIIIDIKAEATFYLCLVIRT
jgi:hypothetical protein